MKGCETALDAWNILKERYEGRTRTHLHHLFKATMAKFDDRKTMLMEHISAFKNSWLKLSQNVASATAGTDSIVAGIKNFTRTDPWKASMLLASLPLIQAYTNVIDNIATKEDTVTYYYGMMVRDSDYTLGGRRDDGRTAGRREDSGTTGG